MSILIHIPSFINSFSGSGSYKLSCSNATDSNGFFTRNTTFYTESPICEGESDPDLLKIGKILLCLLVWP